MRRFWLALAALSWLVAAPSSPSAAAASAIDYAAINAAAVSGHVIPRYGSFADAAGGLDAEAGRFCAAPSEAGLETLRAAFQALWDAWSGVQHIGFGPVQQDARSFRIQFWPDPRDKVGKSLSGMLAAREADRLKPAAFAETSVAVQGLPTLERLLYGADAARLRGQDEDAGYRCAFLRAITANLSAIGGAMLAEWTAPDGYAAVVASGGGGKGVYHSADEATLDLLKCMLTALELTADQRLTQPMGGDPAKARPRALEAWRSGRPLRNALLSLEAVEALYLAGPGGFSDAVKAAGAADLDARVRSEFAHAHDAATAIDRPLQEAVMELDGRFRIEVLATHLRSLRDLMARDVALALSISPGFNSLDGD